MKVKVLNNIFIRYSESDKSNQSIWFIHGFADSGLAYTEVFTSALSTDADLYVVDLPGFGVSPLNSECISIKEQAEFLAKIIKKETRNNQQVNIVAHSIGALIGTWICKELNTKINYYFNIEGNLTEADSYFSSKPIQYKTPNDFVKAFENKLLKNAQNQERYRRYYSSFKFASPQGMYNWSATSQEHVTGNKCGFEFKELNCKKVYIWGNIDTPQETQEFILQEHIPNIRYNNVGHWHMIENSDIFYNDISKIIKNGMEQFV